MVAFKRREVMRSLRYINLTMQLLDNRVLLRRRITHLEKQEHYFGGWEITLSRLLTANEEPLSKFNEVLLEQFGIDSNTYDDSFVNMKRLPPVELPELLATVTPFVIKFKEPILRFKTKRENLFRALSFGHILTEIMTKTVYPRQGSTPMHTRMAVEIARILQQKEAIHG
jgi:hypothetical protein